MGLGRVPCLWVWLVAGDEGCMLGGLRAPSKRSQQYTLISVTVHPPLAVL